MPIAERRVPYVAPLGAFSVAEQELLTASCDYLTLYFGLPLEVLAPISLESAPGNAQRENGRGYGPQVHSWWILSRVLIPRLPDDAAALIGLTTRDLRPGQGWNFVLCQVSVIEFHPSSHPNRYTASSPSYLAMARPAAGPSVCSPTT